MGDFNEQEFFYVAAVRSDGKPPHLGKAIYGKIFLCEEDAKVVRNHARGEFGHDYAIFRAVARWPGEDV